MMILDLSIDLEIFFYQNKFKANLHCNLTICRVNNEETIFYNIRAIRPVMYYRQRLRRAFYLFLSYIFDDFIYNFIK